MSRHLLRFIPFRFILSLGFLCFSYAICSGQIDTTTVVPDSAQEEDYSQYENMVPVADSTPKYASTKIFDLSPQKLISIGYDYAFGSRLEYHSAQPTSNQYNYKYASSHGLRLGFNIPMISKNKLTWTLAGNYIGHKFKSKEKQNSSFKSEPHYLLDSSLQQGLHNTMLQSTIYRPLNAKTFILAQLQADVSGDYQFSNFGTYLQYSKVSGAVIWGKRPHDRLQWGLGVSRTYRAGELNYIPILMYNYTWPNRKWGSEVLFPARAAIRRTFNSRSLLLFGYELEGQSYFIKNMVNSRSQPNKAIETPELRRSEIRLRFTYERSLKGFIWLSFQAGYRLAYSYNVDDGDFSRYFIKDDPYAANVNLSNAPYFLVSLNLVSP